MGHGRRGGRLGSGVVLKMQQAAYWGVAEYLQVFYVVLFIVSIIFQFTRRSKRTYAASRKIGASRTVER
jgi:hypothetical protein